MNKLETHEMHQYARKPLNVEILRNALVAFFTFELKPDAGYSSLFGQNPFASSERRIVPDVLVMSAFEFCTPVAFIVRVVANYPFFHELSRAAATTAGRTPPEKYRQRDNPAHG